MREAVRLFGPERSLVGVLTEPAAGSRRRGVGVVLLDAGMVHHAGPHRLHVDLARRLARAGFPCVRFDFSGIGDSPARRDNLPLERSTVLEARQVMDDLAAERGLDRFMLGGICTGASVAFKVATEDPRVAGALLINPRSYDTSRELDTHITERGLAEYYLTVAARDPRRWLRFLTGRGRYRRIVRALGAQLTGWVSRRRLLERESVRLAAEIRGVVESGRRLLFLFSEGDAGLSHLRLILGRRLAELEGAGPARQVVVPRSDHTFTLSRRREQVFRIVEEWIEGLADAEPPGGGLGVEPVERVHGHAAAGAPPQFVIG